MTYGWKARNIADAKKPKEPKTDDPLQGIKRLKDGIYNLLDGAAWKSRKQVIEDVRGVPETIPAKWKREVPLPDGGFMEVDIRELGDVLELD